MALDPTPKGGKGAEGGKAAVLITCEELSLTTEPFLYSVTSKLLNDEGV